MRKWIVVAALAFVVLVAAAAVTARLLYPPERVRALIIEQVSRAVGAPVTVEEAKVSFFPLGVSVAGVTVGNPVEGEPSLLELPEGTVSIKILPLLSRRVDVARVFLRDPVIHLVRPEPPPPPEGGAETTPVPFEGAPGGEEEGGASFALLLSSAEVENASVTYVDRAAGAAYQIGGLDAKTSLGLERDGKVAAEGGVWIGALFGPSIEALGFMGGFRDLAIDYDLRYDPAAGTAEIRSLRCRLARLALDLTGEASGLPDSLRADLTLATERIELADLLSLLPSDQAAAAADFEGSGPLSVEGEIHVGPGASPAFRVAVGLGGLDVRNKKFSESITGLKGRIEATETAVRLDGVAGSLGGRPFSLNGTVENFADPAVDVAVKADLDLGALGRAGLLPEGTELAGALDADVRARGRAADPNGVALEGSVKIASARLAVAEPPVEATNASGNVVLAGRSAEIKILKFDLNGSPTTLTGKVTDPLGDLRATADLTTRKIDFNAFLPSAGEGGGKGASSAGTAADPPPLVLPPLPPITLAATIKADTVITGVNLLIGVEAVLDVVNGEGTVRIRMARGLFGGVAVTEAAGNLRVEDRALSGDLSAKEALAYRVPLTAIRGKIALTPEGVVTLDGVTAKVWEGTVAGDASVRLNEPGGAAYRFNARAENVEANDFLTHLTPAKNILFGKFRLESAWAGKGLTEEELLKSLSADGTMKAADGRIRNLTALKRAADLLGLKEMEQIEFREFWSKFSVEKGRVRFDDLLVRGKNADWNAAGSVGFDGTLDYALTIALSEANSAAYRKKSALTSLFTDGSGRVVLDVKVGGTAEKPAITLDASKTASRAGIEGLDKVIDDIQNDENVQKAIGDLLGGKAPSLEGLLGGSKKKTPPDTAKAAGQK